MKKQHVIGVVVAVVCVVAFLGYPQVRLFQLKGDADKVLKDDLGRFPTPAQILSIDDTLTAVAQKHGFTSPTYAKNMTTRSLAGTSELYHVLEIKMTVDGKVLQLSQRIDTAGIENEFGALMEAGITVGGK